MYHRHTQPSPLSRRRFFTDQQRKELFVLARGQCMHCGQELPPNFECHHIIPYSQGGLTEILNGIALCPPCHRKIERNRYHMASKLPPWEKPLRKWQERAFNQYVARSHTSFTAAVTPGAGKTRLGLRISHHELSTHNMERVVVVVNSLLVGKQWQEAAHDVNIELQMQGLTGARKETSDQHGMIVTYAAVANHPQFHALLAEKHKTLVVLDETHHCGLDLTWSLGVENAFRGAAAQLLLTGTPFRGDERPLPFVRYTEVADGLAPELDFTYTYSEALTARECRPLIFCSFDGEMTWRWKSEIEQASFADPLYEEDCNRRLRTALDLQGEWLPEVLRKAHAKLLEIRRTHPQAGGLVLAMEHTHAKAIAAWMQKNLKVEVMVIIRDDDHGVKKTALMLENFKKADTPWIVAVKLLGEGVDIPRLRTLVLATHVTARLFFHQAVGRVVRWEKDLEGKTDQCAHVFLPHDQRLLALAQSLKQQSDDYLAKMVEAETGPTEEAAWGEAEATEPRPVGEFQPLSSTPGVLAGVINGDVALMPHEVERAEAYLRQTGQVMEPAQLAQILRLHAADLAVGGGGAAGVTGQSEPMRESRPLEEQKLDLRQQVHRMVNQLAYARGVEPEKVYQSLKQWQQVSQADATYTQLEARRQWLAGQLARG